MSGFTGLKAKQSMSHSDVYSDYENRSNLRPSGQQFGDLRPAVSQHAVSLVDDEIFLRGPRALLDVWVEVVVPAFPALLSQTALQVFGHHRPLLAAVLLHQLNHLTEQHSQAGLKHRSTNTLLRLL